MTTSNSTDSIVVFPERFQVRGDNRHSFKVRKRTGDVVAFDTNKVARAILRSFLAVEGEEASASTRIREKVGQLTADVVEAFERRHADGSVIDIEAIQDQVELVLMRAEEQKVARAYVLYREDRKKERQDESVPVPQSSGIRILNQAGELEPLDETRMRLVIQEACDGLSGVDGELVFKETLKGLYDGVPLRDVSKAMMLSARMLVEKEPNYTYATARLLSDQIRGDALGHLGLNDLATFNDMADLYPQTFLNYVDKAVDLEQIDPQVVARYDLDQMANAIDHTRDGDFTYLAIQTLYDRYLLHDDGVRYELPQCLFMRVVMGLCQNEDDPTAKAIDAYNLLSSRDYMTSTPTLFNSGTLRPQLSSCYLTTVSDNLEGIYDAITENALLSKWAGGLGNDWTPVRGLGSRIKGTNGKSQGVVPFLKVVNDTAVAVNQCFAPETLIRTAQGVREIQSLTVGDLVLGIKGNYREVTEVMQYDQKDTMVSVSVKHAIEPVNVTAGHPFYVIRGVPMEQNMERTVKAIEDGRVSPAWVDAGELVKGDYLAQVVPQEVVVALGYSVDDFHLYGILLGDGHQSGNRREWGVTGRIDAEHIAFVKSYLDERQIHYWEHVRDNSCVQVRWTVGANTPSIDFTYDDLYTVNDEKHIAPRFSHLPKEHTLALIKGLLETDGHVSRGKEITFCSTSRQLVEGLRYQLLRLSIPTSGQYRERQIDHTATRGDGSTSHFKGDVKAFDLRIPAAYGIAELVGCEPLTKYNWVVYNGHVFTRVTEVAPAEVSPLVYDLKVEGDESYMTAIGLAHNGGKRKGAVCAYLETWHIDIEEYTELRKNTGDDRRRTHDMNTANWIPDLFMERVHQDGQWTLFSPSDVPDLHDLYGNDFRTRYEQYEAMADQGKIALFKRVNAKDLWRRLLSMLFETGHPWLTFKDPCNLRSPQQHVGVVHSSNLCTEITLNTGPDEIAVCNLGSVNLARHVADGELDYAKLTQTVRTAVRLLDNVIDVNYYAVEKARNSNRRHRPVGLGLMGFQDALYMLGIPYGSQEAIDFADRSMEMISYAAIEASSDLAVERGRYESYDGSLWSQGILPIDSIHALAKTRSSDYLDQDRSTSLDWDALRAKVLQQGMRNSNVMAIAPTATISNICGATQSIEPTYQNLYVKSNLSGEFTVINEHLVRSLKEAGLWDEVMINDLKYYDGSLQDIDRIPEDLKALYATAFEVDPEFIVQCASRRQKWIDQAQSLNLYISGVSGKKLDHIYRLAWRSGLKTTYYLRAQSASRLEKSTLKGTDGKLSGVPAQPSQYDRGQTPTPTPVEEPSMPASMKLCSIDNPDCEACQ